ncbi:MAG: DcaP family trimeric outer membrane transporter, partial [Methylococcaceae bacterium]|nr:DcaP family trimeric outer membrane transporter [Methylococcaceae bacterium]
MLIRIAIFTLLSFFLTPQAHAEENLQQTVNELREQLRLLTARMEAMEKKLEEKELSESASSGPVALSQHKQTTAASPKTASKSTAKPVETGAIKGSIKIPATDTSLAIGGFVKLDAIYNSQSTGDNGRTNQGDQWLVPGSIPVDDSHAEANQITFHARSSRFWLKSFTPTRLGDLNTYLEMDFFAFQAPGDERVSNSYAPRMRHAYGQLGRFLAGQTWTTFMDARALPELNDFAGAPLGRIFVRQPQVRWTQPFMIGTHPVDWDVALESPESTLTDPNGLRE